MTKTQAVTRTQHPDFSFATETRTKRGELVSTDWFDIPLTDAMSNNGLLAFRELMTLIADTDGGGGLIPRHVVRAAALAMDAPVMNGKSQRWAAMQFMNQVSGALRFFAQHAAWQAHIDAQIENSVRFREQSEREQKERMAELTRRSVAARAARKAAQALAANGAV